MNTRRTLAALLREMNGDDPAPYCVREVETADEPIMWQYVERKHVAPGIALDEWEAFVEEWEDEIADQISLLVKSYWEDHVRRRTPPERLPAHLYFFENGQAMAFDEAGEQVPDWHQGNSEIEAKLAALSAEDRARIEVRRNCDFP